MQIRRVGVIGAGTMGAAIAALLAGAGLSVVLLDMPPERLSDDEAAAGLPLTDRRVRDRLARAGFSRMCAARPANLFRPADAERITVGNTADDFDLLADCDWVIEVIVERLAAKQALLSRLAAVVGPAAIVTTNTSGIPIAEIAAVVPHDLQRRFFGTHFFNPPRYLKLLELIAGPQTDPELLASFARFAEEQLGKGVVFCHDRPNFVGNRIFAYSALRVLNYALDHQCRVDDIDALTGPLIGRPSTASFRLLDAVGLDVMRHVTDNLADGVPDDESRAIFAPHPLLNQLIADGRLGRKSGQGFYREVRVDGQREFHVLNLQTLQYEPARELPTAAQLQAATRGMNSVERIRLLLGRAAADPHDGCANLIAAAIYPTLAYAARRLPEIADSVVAVDRAMRWGFAHELGPFELWQALGIAETAAALRAYGETLPAWIDHLISAGDGFYQHRKGRLLAYHVPSATLQPLAQDPRAVVLDELPPAPALQAIDPALHDLGNNLAAFVVPNGAGLLDAPFSARLLHVIESLSAQSWRGLIVLGRDGRFSPAADRPPAAADRDATLRAAHRLLTTLRYGPLPVAVAAAGRLHGSLCSLAWHSRALVCAIETGIGLPDITASRVALAGSAAALNRRLIAAAVRRGDDPHRALAQVLTTVALGQLSGSASEARDSGLLTADDTILFNQDLLIGTARDLLSTASVPAPTADCYALGRAGLATARRTLDGLRAAGRLSAQAADAALTFAGLLCGPADTVGWCDSAQLFAAELSIG